jgi:hypothetical protein
MGRCLAVLIVLGCAALTGCLSGSGERTTARLHSPPMAGVVGDDVIYVDVAIIERPLGDAFLNRELWSEADEEVVHIDAEQFASLERKTALEKNGFRVGQVEGQLPTKLQDMLDAEHGCQTRRIQLHAGHETTLALGSSWPRYRCRLQHDDRTTSVDVEKAQCELDVVPSLAEEGRIRLRCTPHLKHGDVKTSFLPVRDADGQLHWGRQEHQLDEVYPWLSWTLQVAPNEYVVVGALLDSGETLGEQFFLTQQEDHPIVQRLLVLRATHVPTPAGPAIEDMGPCPPLALRAGLIAVRGSGE